METIDLQSVFADGVCVTRRLRRDESQPPLVTYDIESQRSEPVTVTVVDEVPGDDPTALEFHRDYGASDWTVTGSRLVFEHELEPSENYETLYRLREVPGKAVADDLPKPVVETDSALIENPTLDLRDPRTQATDGGAAPSGGERR